MKNEISHVTDTALWVATYRALETERKDALFSDPLAGKLAGEKGMKIANSMSTSRITEWSVVIRTSIIDSFIYELVKEGVDTVLNLGAGLDTRPYRMQLPATLRWIEVDYPKMIAFKEGKLTGEKTKIPTERISLDLADRSERLKLFARIGSESKKVLVLTEGVLPYLTEEQVAELGQDLSKQETFRFWIVDYFAPHVIHYLRRSKIRNQMKNAPFLFFPKNWSEFFLMNKWKVRQMRYLGEESLKLGRQMPMPKLMKFFYFLTPKTKRDRFHKATAYVLLEPSGS